MFSNQHSKDFSHSILLANNTNGDRVELKTDNNHNLRTALIGNTNADGSGDAHHLHVDSNGIAKTQVVNAPTIIPHSELNSGTNDNPRDSIAVGLRARQVITDETTETFLQCENGGKLQVQVVGSNDINGGTPHRHLTIDANGRTLTNPLMTTTNTHLSNISNNTDKTKTHSTQSSINFADNSTTNSNSVEIKNTNIGIIWKTQVSMLQNPELQVSVDDSNWFTLKSGLSLGTFNLDLSGDYVLVANFDIPFKYVRVSANQSGHGSDITGDITFSNL